MKTSIVLLALLCSAGTTHVLADTFGGGPNTFNIDFVTIGNPGNAADITGVPNPAGSVAYEFRMGKYEIAEQMIDKANAAGGLGIDIIIRGPDKPAISVSWNEAARFVNWLNTSAGSTPAYKFALQPGEAGYHPNQNILLWEESDLGYNANNRFRNSRARYFLPSANEWYKAAFFDPTSGVYFDYATGSNSASTAVVSGTAAGTAVYNGQVGPADITLAGGLSAYGTMAQGGNAVEWEETDFDLMNDSVLSTRGVRGGSWNNNVNTLHASFRGNDTPTNGATIGFRVASVPEPSMLLLVAMVGVPVLLIRRRFTPPSRLTSADGLADP